MQVNKYNDNYVKCNGQMKIDYCRECPYYCGEDSEFVECADDQYDDIYFKIRKVNRIKNDLEEFYKKNKSKSFKET